MKGPIMTGLWIVIIVIICYTAYLGYLFFFQSHLVYYPEKTLVADPSLIRLDFDDVSFRTQDGLILSGWFIPCERSRGVILFCHGNAGNISHRLESINIFHNLDLDVFIFDYRGYGKSEGKPSEEGTYLDAEAAWQYLVNERQVSPGNIIIFGRSLGGAIAAWLAKNYESGALILESTFTSAYDFAVRVYPFVPVRLLVRFQYNTTDYLYQINCPVLIIHSRDDELMPFEHGMRLFEVANEPKKFLEIHGSHNEGYLTSGKLYEDGLNTFIAEYVDPKFRRID
jgi:pimeloyl-ACP methyl ester carboxylesterase